NGELNRVQSSSYSATASLRKFVRQKFDFSLNGGPSYSYGRSSLQTDRDNNGWGWNGNYSFNIYLPLKFQISSEGRYNYTAPTQLFEESLERFIIDASVSKKFLKDETLKLTVGMND